FDGRYRIIRKLGAGGMANVYLAEDQELGRRVAIKILDDRHAADDSFIERFRREAKTAAGLSHPNIVSIYDRGEAEGTYYIAMEYLEGRTLKELILSRGPTPIPVAIDYTRQILAALSFAHRNGIVHRDIKPHNVVVGPDGRLKVTDFGIARSAGTSQMTEAGSIIGTAQDRSPTAARMEAAVGGGAAGGAASSETEEAATAVLSGAGLAAAATQIAPRRAAPPAYKPPPSGIYEYEEPIRRRPVWPWLLALLLLVAAGFAGWYVYTKVQDQLNANKQVRVPYVVGIKEILADQKIRAAGL